ncbi:MAG: exodeoxyribonuclease V subunit gamma [Chlorobiaceae bacterium]|nr:exodeoxyribonuclease V subunit gamma [Chlorobiaceae bacterium]
MSLNLYTSNRMEILVDALAGALGRPPALVFEREVIVVQSRGMQRWLSMELAKRFGVWANGHYPFPNAMVKELFEQFFSEKPDTSLFKPDVMSWRIMRLLPEMLRSEPFGTLRRYLSDDSDGLKLFQLSEKIADTFDQYTLYRPEMLSAWEVGREEPPGGEWQPFLWRRLSKEGGMHRGTLKERFCRELDAALPGAGQFPERITLFGISYLPNFHLDMLSAVARVTEVNLFLLSPTGEYWGDILSRKAIAALPEEERALRTEGNPLLASLGRIGRDFSDMIIDLADSAYHQEDCYDDPGDDCLLHALQSDILNLTGTGEEGEMRILDPEDRSLRVNSCHSALREVEVLYDNILAMLEEVPGLTPRDIVVMTPDIETYSPYISAVFGAGAGGAFLPYTIADRKTMHEGEITSALLKLLALPGSRLAASELYDLLASPPVSRRFSLESEELDLVREWIERTGIRWGMDEHDRTARNLPSYRENSWKAGLDRLLLGYAMPDDGMLFNGILPFDDLAGSSAETLGKFADFVAEVENFVKSMEVPRTLEEWRTRFQAMLDTFILPDGSSEREFASIAALAGELQEVASKAGYVEKVSPAVIISWLRARLEKQEQGLGFMTGGVTFCAMLPMRSIPFRVVAMIGMNDGAFPRQSRAPGFDLIAREPRRGDRSSRNEDRYLFLESILSARDVLYISYVGQSIRDNSEVPPSVLVSELLDAVRRGFCLPGCRIEAHDLVVRHRLQAFNREYFTEGIGLFSYSKENYDAVSEHEGPERSSLPFMSAPLDEPSDEWKIVSLQHLLRFYDNPAAFFLDQRLGIRMESAVEPLDDREPFGLEGLELYGIRQELLDVALQDGEPQEQLPLWRSRGMLPPARHGELLFGRVVGEVREFASTVRARAGASGPLAPLDIDLQIGGFRLVGQLSKVWLQGLLHYRCAKLKMKDRMRAWIEHLALNAAGQPGYPKETSLVMTDCEVRFAPVDYAPLHLEHLLNRYWQGLSMPLRFFPRSSMAFAEKEEIEVARKEWRDDTFNNLPGEGSDPAIRRCFGSGDPFDVEFRTIAIELLKPMIRAAGDGTV